MPDITMCSNNECERKENCYRHNATPDHLQSYSDFKPYCNKDKWEYFWNDERCEE